MSIIASLIFGTDFNLVWFIIGAAILVFELYMIVNAITNQAITQNAKILWVVGMLLIHPIVAVVYYFTDYKKSRL